VPFDGFRPALTGALQVLGILRADEVIDDKISAAEREWGFGSMVRCALGLSHEDNSIERSGTLVQRLTAMPIESSWITRCSSTFLRTLPPSLRVVVLLSNDDKYIEACFAVVRRLRSGTRRINSVAYGDDQITWVHIIHVGGPGKNHIAAWLAGQGTQGEKRRDAQAAVRLALGEGAVQGPIPVPISKVQESETRPRKFRAPSGSTGKGKLIPSNPLRDAILSSMKAHTFFVQHPAETQVDGTKYVSAFLGKNGRAIAFDKAAASKQPMWMLDEPQMRKLLGSLEVRFDDYPPAKSRNSNLKRLPELRDKAVLRAFPQTEGEAMAIVEGVARMA
jgi:hypothetical protein